MQKWVINLFYCFFKLNSLTFSVPFQELEEAVVLKICEAVTDKSEIGQMRQKHQSLEQDLESWKKKAVQYEKQVGLSWLKNLNLLVNTK